MRSLARIAVATVVGAAVLALAALWLITQPTLTSSAAAPLPARADPARLERHVRMLAETLHPRDHRHGENLDRAAVYVFGELVRAGARVREQAYEVDGRRVKNVVAELGPDAGERIVVGAHYDAFGPLPGADDNASGVAGLMALARLLGQAKLATRVDLVAYTLEEPPYFKTEYMGSYVHAQSLRKEGVALRAMISLEMIGYFSDADGSQDYPSSVLGWFYPSQGNFIGVVSNLGSASLMRRIKRAMTAATDLPVESLAGPSFMMGIDWSDQVNYWNAGYDAVMVTDTAFLRNRNYHTERDTADRLDYVRMAKVVQAVHGAVMELAK